MNLSKLKTTTQRLTPYALMLLFSLIGTIIVFWSGLNKGDDYFYHIPNILDKYNSIINGNGYPFISAETAGGLGYGAGLFYSPLSHFSVAVFGAGLKIFGISLMTSYKAMIVLSVFASGLFMYDFAMSFTSGNKVASLIASACLILYPYRLFNIFCRIAFAEAFAFTFMPLFLCGVYEITHMKRDEIKTLPFVKLIIGASFIFLSHNLTAVFAFVIGFLFFLLYTNRIVKLFASKKYLILCGISALLVIGISAVALFSQLELLGMDFYAVSNDESMRTDVESVLSHVDRSWLYSGFLNIDFLSGLGYSASYLYNGIVLFLIGCAVFVIVDTLLSRVARLKHFHYLISTPVLALIISLTARRLEIYLGALIFVVLYIFISLKDCEQDKERPIYKRPIFWFSISVILLSFFAMSTKWVWEIVPGFLRTIQFPWRLWSFVQMFLSILVGVLAQHFAKTKKVLVFIAIFVGLLMVLNMPILEKRNASDDNWFDTISESDLDHSAAIGHQKEYCPQIYLQNGYEPRENSLYNAVRRNIFKYTYEKNDVLSPVILVGKGEISDFSVSAPKSEMKVTLLEESEIQMPLFFYPGYKIFVFDETGEKTKLTPYEVDGLVSFKLGAGQYTVKTDFVGTPVQITGRALTIISVILTLLLLGYGLWKETKLKSLCSKLSKRKART